MNEPMTLKRPKPGDGEEELYRMQEEFLQTRQEPSAKVINLRAQNKSSVPIAIVTTESPKPSGKIRSKFAERKALQQQERVSTSQSGGPMINVKVSESLDNEKGSETISDPVQNLPLNPSSIILGRIVEKQYDKEIDRAKLASCSILANNEKGFPEVFRIDHKLSNNAGSLFLQEVCKNANPQVSLGSIKKEPVSGIPERNIQIGDSLKMEIHQANMEKLKQMSQEEILQAKLQLESTISPNIIEFLRTTRKSNKTIEMERDLSDKIGANNDKNESYASESNKAVESKSITEAMECDVDPIGTVIPVAELVEAAATKGWMHMDTIEREKLEWMKDVEPTKSEASPASNEPYNARFDFNGVLLPFQDDNLSVDKGLHHHGEEPERPGYALQELLQLSRSSTQQQRCTALNTLANIMEKSRKGWYDKVLHPAPLVALNEKNILLLLRFSLDDTSVAVVTATLLALRAFLYSEADEICLDRLVGWCYDDGQIVEPELPAPKTDVTDTSNLKDHELAQLDTVEAAMRSDIILRIRYILSEMHPSPIGVTAALEILIRLARQSRKTALNIACTPRLLETIVTSFIPLSVDRSTQQDETRDAYGLPSVVAVRLCRVLITYAGKPVADRLNNLKIVHPIISYTTSEATTIGIRLSIESLRLWKLLLSRNVAMDSVSGVRISLLAQLQLLLSHHDLGGSSELTCEHAAALIDVCVHEPTSRVSVSTLLKKWTTQLSKISSPTWSQTKLVALTLRALRDDSEIKCTWIASSNILTNLCSTSNLLSGYTLASEREPSPLPNLGVLVENGKSLQPSVSLNSCIPFLATWIYGLCEKTRIAEFGAILNISDFMRYIRRLSKEDWSLESSWYTRPELSLVTGIVRAVSFLSEQNKRVNESTQRIVQRISIKLVSTLPSDASLAVREILRYVLNDERLTVDELSNSLNSLKLDNSKEKTLRLLDLPNDISTIYGEYISASGSWDQAAMPKDWLYLPLVAAYTEHKNKLDKWNDQDTTRIVVQLSLELIMPELVDHLPPSLRFSRLLLIYLCDTIYLNEDVSILLNQVQSLLLKESYKRFDFAGDLPGLSSFTDLFTSLCEAFCANSYGNDVFSMALLVPLSQRHDVHYRKLLWSEHAAALRYLRLKTDKLMVPLSEFLYPVETDASLIESYLTALVRGTVKSCWCPLMYHIALHHSAMYLRGTDKLAVRMRTKIGNLKDRELSDALLNYEEPPHTTR